MSAPTARVTATARADQGVRAFLAAGARLSVCVAPTFGRFRLGGPVGAFRAH